MRTSQTEQQVQRTYDLVRQMAVGTAPAPWREVDVEGVGGLWNVGFVEGAELLLVCASSGRSLIDCTTGRVVARDEAEGEADRLQQTGRGIGPVVGVPVRMAGHCGGVLPATTPDGWSITFIHHDWPAGSAVLQPPGADVWLDAHCDRCVRLVAYEIFRAGGFSPSGRTLVIAEPHGLRVFTRASR